MNLATPPVSDQAAGKPADMSDAEWDTRVDLAAAYRLVDHFGMADLVYNHITARLPEAPEHFLINEFGLHYSEITASSLVTIDHDGAVVDGSGRPVNPAGFVIHSCIHRARPDVNCVVHTHTRAGMAISALEDGLLPVEQEGFQFYDRLAYHDYEGIALDTDEQSRLVADLGDRNAMILRNHGLVACGGTVSEAFRRIYYLESACRVQLDLMATGRPLRLPPDEVCEHTARQWETGVASLGGGPKPTLEWPAMMRMMDRKDPGFRR